jgi:hypothetical protein
MDRWTVRALTLQETLHLFQMPLGICPLAWTHCWRASIRDIGFCLWISRPRICSLRSFANYGVIMGGGWEMLKEKRRKRRREFI